MPDGEVRNADFGDVGCNVCGIEGNEHVFQRSVRRRRVFQTVPNAIEQNALLFELLDVVRQFVLRPGFMEVVVHLVCDVHALNERIPVKTGGTFQTGGTRGSVLRQNGNG